MQQTCEVRDLRKAKAETHIELAQVSAFLEARFLKSGFSLLAETEYSDRLKDLAWGKLTRSDGCFSLLENEIVNFQNLSSISVIGARRTLEYRQKLEVMKSYKIVVEFEFPDVFSVSSDDKFNVSLEVTGHCESIKKPSWDSLSVFFSVVDLRLLATSTNFHSDVVDLSKISKVLKDLNELNLGHRSAFLGVRGGLTTEEFVCASYGYAMGLLDEQQLVEIYRVASAKIAQFEPRASVRSLLIDLMRLSPDLRYGDPRSQFISTLITW